MHGCFLCFHIQVPHVMKPVKFELVALYSMYWVSFICKMWRTSLDMYLYGIEWSSSYKLVYLVNKWSIPFVNHRILRCSLVHEFSIFPTSMSNPKHGSFQVSNTDCWFPEHATNIFLKSLERKRPSYYFFHLLFYKNVN